MNEEAFLKIFPKSFHIFMGQAAKLAGEINEIRMRVHAPIIIRSLGREYFIDPKGNMIHNIEQAYRMNEHEMELFLQYSCRDSVYAFEEEIKKGFLTIQGGHRIGIAGQVVLDSYSNIKTIKNITCFNIRIAHEIKNAAKNILPFLYYNNRLQNTLIISPPGCGKTTMLRDIIRQVSNGNKYGEACQISIVDERSEIAGCYQGIPQNDVGLRTDVMDACPKQIGMMMLLRSMSPQVMAIDELGGKEDVEALIHVINSGCSILVTMHGENIEEVKRKRYMQSIFTEQIFKRIVLLSKEQDKYIVKNILNEDLNPC